MSDAFDPYYAWLSIPPDEQPPNYYRLLGVKLFESNAEVIASAADRQMAHVRNFQTGKHAAASQQLLNRLSAARVCLLDPQRKSEYDRTLPTRRMAAPPPPSPPPPAAPPPPASPLPPASPPRTVPTAVVWAGAPVAQPPAGVTPLETAPAPLAADSPATDDDALLGFDPLTARGRRRRRKKSDLTYLAVAFTVVGLVVVVGIGAWVMNRPSDDAPPGASSDPARAANIAAARATAAKPPVAKPPAAKPTIDDPASVAVPAGMRKLPLGAWVDVLPLAADDELAKLGWTRQGDELQTKRHVMARDTLPLPVRIQGDYELSLEYTRTKGIETIGVGFQVDGKMAAAIVGRFGHGFALHEIPGERIGAGHVSMELQAESHARHRLLIRVGHEGSDATIHADLDENKLNWKGASNGLEPVADLVTDQLSLFTRHFSEFRIHSLKVRVYKGHAFVPDNKNAK